MIEFNLNRTINQAQGYAILRTQKLKDKGSIHRSLKHSFRAQETPNADPERTPENTHIGAGTVEGAMDKITERLSTQEKIRKNAVLAIEYLITGSPEALNEKSRVGQDNYFRDAMDWLREKHGAENVVYAGIHRDETTPHLYAYVVPIDDRGKLNCRAYLGGAKALNEMQTDFAEKVGEKHGLDRGIEGSKAKHKSIRKYYAEIQKPTPQLTTPDIQKDNKFLAKETDDSFRDRVAFEMAMQAQPAIEKSKLYDAAKQEAKQYKRTAEKLQGEAKQYRELMDDLSPDQQQEIKQNADQHRTENALKKQQEAERLRLEKERKAEQKRLDQEREKLERRKRRLAQEKASREKLKRLRQGRSQKDNGLER